MPPDDAATTAAADQHTALNPSTAPRVLAAIAQDRPELRAAVAMNPATYPALLEWLANLGDPVVNAALATRGAAPAAAPAPDPVSTAAHATPPSPGAERPVHTKRRRGLLIGATAGVLVLTGGGYLASQLLNTTPPATAVTTPGLTAPCCRPCRVRMGAS